MFGQSFTGRKYVFSFTYAVVNTFSVATVVAPSVQSHIIFRFLAGAFGFSYQNNAGGAIADMFEAGERGLALTIFAAAPFLGGLAFISLAVGMMGAVIYSIFENRRYNSILEQIASGHAEPEARLPPSIIGAIAVPIGLFWFAWTNSASIHWLASIAAGVPLEFWVVLVISQSPTTSLVPTLFMLP